MTIELLHRLYCCGVLCCIAAGIAFMLVFTFDPELKR